MQFISCSIHTEQGLVSYDAGYLFNNFDTLLDSDQPVVLNLKDEDGSLSGVDFHRIIHKLGRDKVKSMIGLVIQPIPPELSGISFYTSTEPELIGSAIIPIGVVRSFKNPPAVLTTRWGNRIREYHLVGRNPERLIYVHEDSYIPQVWAINTQPLHGAILVTGVPEAYLTQSIMDKDYRVVWSCTINSMCVVTSNNALLSSGITLQAEDTIHMSMTNNTRSNQSIGQVSFSRLSGCRLSFTWLPSQSKFTVAVRAPGNDVEWVYLTENFGTRRLLYEFNPKGMLKYGNELKFNPNNPGFVSSPVSFPLTGYYDLDHPTPIFHPSPNVKIHVAQIKRGNCVLFKGFATVANSTVFSATPAPANCLWDAVSRRYILPTTGTLGTEINNY